MDSFDLDLAYTEGWTAYNDAVPITANPYEHDDFLYNAWIEGWQEAEDAMESVDTLSTNDFGIEHLLCLLVIIAFCTVLFGWLFGG